MGKHGDFTAGEDAEFLKLIVPAANTRSR